jgi:hypothetical protein
LRETGKQIPQRRVDGDGDVPLAKRPRPAPAEVTTEVSPPLEQAATTARPDLPQEPGPGPPEATPARKGTTAAESTPAPARPRTGRARRGVLLAAAAATVVIAGSAITALVLVTGGSGGSPGSNLHADATTGTYTATAPWRLKIDDRISGNDNGCTIKLTNAQSSQPVRQLDSLYGTYMFQIHQAGSFRWQVNNPGCVVAASAGPGRDSLPLAWDQSGDSDAFTAPARVAVQVKNYNGNPDCKITLNDPANGQAIDFQDATRGKANDTVVLNASGHPTAYLSDLICAVRVSARP